eukprot:5880285-Prymnesium_polylepis.2
MPLAAQRGDMTSLAIPREKFAQSVLSRRTFALCCTFTSRRGTGCMLPDRKGVFARVLVWLMIAVGHSLASTICPSVPRSGPSDRLSVVISMQYHPAPVFCKINLLWFSRIGFVMCTRTRTQRGLGLGEGSIANVTPESIKIQIYASPPFHVLTSRNNC